MKSKARPPREHVRVQIQTLAKEGITTKEIANKLKVGRTPVFKWKDKNTVSDKKRSGRPKIISSADTKTNQSRNVPGTWKFCTKKHKNSELIKAQ